MGPPAGGLRQTGSPAHPGEGWQGAAHRYGAGVGVSLAGRREQPHDRVKDPNFTDDRRETDLSRRLAQSTGRVGQARTRAAHPTHLLTPQRNEAAPGRARPTPRAPCLSKAGSDKPRPALARPPRRPGRSVCVRSSLRGEHVRGSAGREQIAVVSVARDAAGRPALARSA